MTDEDLANALYTRVLAQVAVLALVASGAASRDAVKMFIDQAVLTMEEHHHGADRPAALAGCRTQLESFLRLLAPLGSADDQVAGREG